MNDRWEVKVFYSTWFGRKPWLCSENVGSKIGVSENLKRAFPIT